MRFSESEIVEDVLEHIRQAGGEFREWRVGAAGNAAASGQLFVISKGADDGQVASEQVRHESAANAPVESTLLFREAYTTYAAQEVVERLAQGFGLQLDRETNPTGAAPSHPGKAVYVYRPVKIPAAA